MHAKNRRAQSPTVFTQFNSVQLTNGSRHDALTGFLTRHGVDALICGGAQMALAEAGIKLYGGVSGEADEAVNALLAGTLGLTPTFIAATTTTSTARAATPAANTDAAITAATELWTLTPG